ncbi:phosphoglycerate mutase [Candidatus Bathyarchaeota archaeon]|nr:MAG: phosphoglycerate mutase [Candidatus Bathyarchaeota archaeon]
MSKLLYVVLDGLGDLPSPLLGGKTPLEAAEIPNMDFLAKNGKTGLMYTIRKGIAPESDAAVISILGYDPVKYHSARGPIEACGAGLKMKDGDLALRCNFATIDWESKRLIDRRVGRNLTTEEAQKLAEAVNENVRLTSTPSEFIFKSTIAHRAVLLIRRKNGKLSGKITNIDPAYSRTLEGLGIAKTQAETKIEKCKPMKPSEEAKLAAELTNEFVEKSHSILEEHEVNLKRKKEGKLPANFILTRDAGDTLPKFPSFKELYGVKFGCMVEMPVEKGIALLCGMEEVELPLTTGNLEVDYQLRAKKVLAVLEQFDGIYIHIKGPDEPGHDGEPEKKKKVIELIDKHFFTNLLREFNLTENIIVVTADHSTPCTVKAHTDDPVPLLISGKNVEADDTIVFNEKECGKGSLVTISGPNLMPMLIDILKK